jgi:hypothetical protein
MTTADELKPQLTDSEQNWLKKQGFSELTARWIFWAKNFINRRDYDGELPPGVIEDRRKVDLLRMAEKIDSIHRNTEDMPWLSKFIGNMFKFGGSQAEQKYPSKKAK